jgi:hypothetical protein
VAVTRAVGNVYLVESDGRHPLLGLLGQERARERIELAEQKSSLEEWQQEAHRLEQQGKLDQAEAVRRTQLHTHLPWPVLDGDARRAGRAPLDPKRLEQAAAAALRIRDPERRAGVGRAAGRDGSSLRAARSRSPKADVRLIDRRQSRAAPLRGLQPELQKCCARCPIRRFQPFNQTRS